VGEEQMVAPVLRRSRRRDAGRLAAAAVEYAAMGWPVCGGAHSLGEGPGMSTASRSRSFLSAASLGDRGTGRACSCDRVGCPAPGAHPISAAWQIEATSDPVEAGRYWLERPDANVILATGRVFDVLDVPAAAGTVALGMINDNLSAAFSFATLLPYIAVTCRRLHDTDRSGWLQLLGLIPIVGWILLIIWCAQEGKSPNRFAQLSAPAG